MIYQLIVGVGGLIALALLFAGMQVIANRVREMRGECRIDSIRCLGCMATGRCRSQAGGTKPARARAVRHR